MKWKCFSYFMWSTGSPYVMNCESATNKSKLVIRKSINLNTFLKWLQILTVCGESIQTRIVYFSWIIFPALEMAFPLIVNSLCLLECSRTHSKKTVHDDPTFHSNDNVNRHCSKVGQKSPFQDAWGTHQNTMCSMQLLRMILVFLFCRTFYQHEEWHRWCAY